MSNWLSDFVMKRNTNRTNCYLFETLDYKRLEEFKEFLKTEYEGLAATDGRGVLLVEHDIQRGTLTDIETGRKIEQTGMDMQSGPFGIHNRLLSTKPTVIIFKYVVLQRHAEMLTDPIIAWSADNQIFAQKGTAVIFTASSSLFNETARSRMAYTVSIPSSTPEERRVAIEKHKKNIEKLIKQQKKIDVHIDVDPNLVNATAGLTLHDVETGCYESFYTTFKDKNGPRFAIPPFTEYKIQILQGYGMQYLEPGHGFEVMGGYDYLKEYVRKRIIRLLRDPSIAAKYGLTTPRGLLLYGPPGTGKTLFANCLAKEIGLPVLKVSSADFMRGIVGETEQRVRRLTQLWESLAPCIVFVDEVDQIAISREKMFIGDSGTRLSMQNLLLDWLGSKKRETFFVGATNFIDKMDKAMVRPGRIDEVAVVFPPDREARKAILKVHTSIVRKVPLKGDVDLDHVADATYMMSGAELEKLIKEAAALAMDDAEDVSMKHFERALEGFDINVQERENTVTGMISKVKRLESVNQTFLNEALNAFREKEERIEPRLEGIIGRL